MTEYRSHSSDSPQSGGISMKEVKRLLDRYYSGDISPEDMLALQLVAFEVESASVHDLHDLPDGICSDLKAIAMLSRYEAETALSVPVEIPENLKDKIVESLGKQAHGKGISNLRRNFRKFLIPAAAAVAAVLVVSSLLFIPNDKKDENLAQLKNNNTIQPAIEQTLPLLPDSVINNLGKEAALSVTTRRGQYAALSRTKSDVSGSKGEDDDNLGYPDAAIKDNDAYIENPAEKTVEDIKAAGPDEKTLIQLAKAGFTIVDAEETDYYIGLSQRTMNSSADLTEETLEKVMRTTKESFHEMAETLMEVKDELRQNSIQMNNVVKILNTVY